jgi:hypothetical protein
MAELSIPSPAAREGSETDISLPGLGVALLDQLLQRGERVHAAVGVDAQLIDEDVAEFGMREVIKPPDFIDGIEQCRDPRAAGAGGCG